MGLQAEGILLYIQFIISHKGIYGNEVPDKALKAACYNNVITACEMEFEENLTIIKSQFRTFNSNQWNTNKSSLYIGQHIIDVCKWTWTTSGS